MAIVYDPGALDRYMTTAVDASPDHPVLIDRFLEDAFELDVDAVADATGAVMIGGVMEHIEEAGFTQATARASSRRTWWPTVISIRFATTRGGSREPLVSSA